MILALDLSTACTGWAKYDRQGNLLEYGRIVPEDKLHNFLKIKYTVDQLIPHMLEANSLVVEGIFLNTFTGGFHNVTGFELLARLSGAVINAYCNNHPTLPMLYKATEARKLVGVKSSSQKAEIQLWVLKGFEQVKYDMAEVDLDDFEALIDAAYAELSAGEIKRPAFKTRMNHISKMIEEATGMGEDVADAILLGSAYVKDSRLEKDPTND